MNKVVLITGASQGFGLEFAKLFARDGYTVLLVARDKEKLESVASILRATYDSTIHVIAQDLAKHDAPHAIHTAVKKLELSVTVLINNAGFATYGAFAESDSETEEDELMVNVLAVTKLTKLFLPAMLEKKEGRILNVASTAAYIPGPFMAVYYASKAYVLSFTEALGVELLGTGVTVSVLCPGPSKTGFITRAKLEYSPLFQGKLSDPKDVAESGYNGLLRGEAVIIPGLYNKSVVFLSHIIPRTVSARIARRLQEKP